MRSSKGYIVLVVYIIWTIIHLMMIIREQEALISFSKLLLMPTLVIYYLMSSSTTSKIKPWIALGILFSFFGDWALIYTATASNRYFMIGLGFFLLAHMSYTMGFGKLKNSLASENKENKSVIPGIILLCTLGFLYFIISSVGTELRVAVTVYAFVICLMSISAYKVFLRFKSRASLLLFLGALSFMISDMVLALVTFVFDQRTVHLSVVIMSTYLIAQYLIVTQSVILEKK